MANKSTNRYDGMLSWLFFILEYVALMVHDSYWLSRIMWQYFVMWLLCKLWEEVFIGAFGACMSRSLETIVYLLQYPIGHTLAWHPCWFHTSLVDIACIPTGLVRCVYRIMYYDESFRTDTPQAFRVYPTLNKVCKWKPYVVYFLI